MRLVCCGGACGAALRANAVPVALLVVVNVIFSGYQVLTEFALKTGMNAVVFALLRDAVAVACFLPTHFFVESRRPVAERQVWPKPEHSGYVTALGFLGVWGAQLLSSLAISNLSATLYGLLTPTVPVVTLVVSVLAGIDTLSARSAASWLKVSGVLITVAGAASVVAFSAGGTTNKNLALGAGYIALQKLCAGSYPVLQKHCLKSFGYPSLMLATWAYVLGTFIIATSAAIACSDAAAWKVTPAGAGAIAFSGILSSFFNYWMMAYVNARTSPLLVM